MATELRAVIAEHILSQHRARYKERPSQHHQQDTPRHHFLNRKRNSTAVEDGKTQHFRPLLAYLTP